MDATSGSGFKILIVEDEPALLRALGGLLRAAGHSVTEAAGVRDALSVLRRQAVDLLISDIHLGADSGLELMRRIRQTSAIPAIAMSGQPEMSGPSLAVGFSAFLDKPVSGHSLLRAIGLVAQPGLEVLVPI